MEVVIPTNDFHFNTSPFSTSPSTPKGFGHFSLTAPSSPTRISEFYRDFDDEFAFDFRLESEGTTLPAEELFESGKIRSSNPPSRFGEPNKKTHLRTEQGRGRERNPSIRNTDKRTEQNRQEVEAEGFFPLQERVGRAKVHGSVQEARGGEGFFEFSGDRRVEFEEEGECFGSRVALHGEQSSFGGLEKENVFAV
ncbi:hypothetical protein C3L33_10973, partial [Rhododendron williamsianum]